MTVQEYQARNVAITSQIATLNSQAISLEQQASVFLSDAQAWRNQKGNDGKGGCKGTAKQKAACEADKTWKEAQAVGKENSANSALSTANSIRNTQIPALEKEFAQNTQQISVAQASAKEVSAILAQQGKTQTSVQTQTMEEAKANYEATLLKANAEAAGIAKSAEADAKNKKTMGYVIAGVGVVVIAIVGYFLVQKFKKRK